jgi:hypothetical protein
MISEMETCQETDGRKIREFALERGYFLSRQLLNPADVMTVRQDIVGILQRHGWIERSDAAVAKVLVPACWEGDERFWPVFDEIQQLESFHSLPHSPALLDLTSTLLDGEILPHPRNIIRLMFPDTPTTPAHQDYLHVRGTEETWTAWIPLGNCPMALGGLALQPRSHKKGLLPVEDTKGAGGKGVVPEHLSSEWHSTDFACGDVLLVHSLCVHKSLPNTSGDQMRLSADYRYQRRDQPIEDRALEPHFGRFVWEDAYMGWKRKDIQHYWKNFDLNVVKRN